jgi:serine protease AprX
MCACIATAAPVSGRLGGVAPDAQLISCRTRFFSTEITDIYDFLVRQKIALGIPIVASNSWGCRTGTPPVPDPDVAEALDDAATAGIVLVFSAGNYHQLVTAPRRCGPNSIWAPKSRANLLTVATCNLDNEMWDYSSRGPGQPSAGPCNDKPDVTAPTPANGRVLYGDRYQVLQTGWGTSGAAPQAAGLAALLLSLEPGLTPPHIFDVIRKSCNNLGFEKTCQGAGLIDCRAAVDMI